MAEQTLEQENANLKRLLETALSLLINADFQDNSNTQKCNLLLKESDCIKKYNLGI